MKKSSIITARLIKEATTSWPFPLAADAHAPLATYITYLMKWNSVMNLVGARRWQDCLHNLIIDSFYLANFLQALPLPEDATTWDLGAGAGLPGVPLRMVWHNGSYTLVEVREKRALFLSNTLAQLASAGTALVNTQVFRGRAEDFFAENTNNYADIVLSRAFMPWVELLQLIEPVVRAGGRAIFLAKEPAPRHILPALGGVAWQVEREAKYTVAQDVRYVWSLQKNI